MKKLSLLCAALLAVGCSNQLSEPTKEIYVGTTPIKFLAPKGMKEITPNMGMIYGLAKEIESAESRNYYFSHYANLNDVKSSYKACSIFTPKAIVYPEVPYDAFLHMKDLMRNMLGEMINSERVQKMVKVRNDKASKYIGDEEEHLGVKLLNDELLYEDANTLIQFMEVENKSKLGKEIQNTRDISVSALSYVKDKMLMFKCQGKPEDKAYLSSLVLDWNKAFLKVNK